MSFSQQAYHTITNTFCLWIRKADWSVWLMLALNGRVAWLLDRWIVSAIRVLSGPNASGEAVRCPAELFFFFTVQLSSAEKIVQVGCQSDFFHGTTGKRNGQYSRARPLPPAYFPKCDPLNYSSHYFLIIAIARRKALQ